MPRDPAVWTIIPFSPPPVVNSLNLVFLPFSTEMLRPLPFPMIKIIIWNARGYSNERFSRYLDELLKYQKPDILLLLETKITREIAACACARMNFPKVHHIDGNRAYEGIWLFWNPNIMHVDMVNESTKAIHVIFQLVARNFNETSDQSEK